MGDVDKVYDRFKNLLDLMISMQCETISSKFTEYDLREIVYLLGELKVVKNDSALSV